MTKRSSASDDAFKRRVAQEFVRARNRAEKRGFSLDDFVRKLGITRAAYYKQVAGKSIPSLRVLAKAKRYWGVRLPYAELGDAYVSAKRTDPRQSALNFSVEDLSMEQIEIKRVSPKGERAVEVLIEIRFPRGA